jgi:hypothetical protein
MTKRHVDRFPSFGWRVNDLAGRGMGPFAGSSKMALQPCPNPRVGEARQIGPVAYAVLLGEETGQTYPTWEAASAEAKRVVH